MSIGQIRRISISLVVVLLAVLVVAFGGACRQGGADEKASAPAGEESAAEPVKPPELVEAAEAAGPAEAEEAPGAAVRAKAPARRAAAPKPDAQAPEPDARAGAPADLHADVEAFFDSLPEEAIVFHVPASAPLQEPFLVRLVVQPGASPEALAQALGETLPAAKREDIHARVAKLAGEMEARLTSPSLQIVLRGADTQLVRRNAPTEWSWDVTAPAGGAHRLTLSLYAVPKGRLSGIKVETFDETLVVEVPFLVRARNMFADNWEWMWTFFLGPLGALGWRRWRRSHPGAQDDPGGDG